MAVQRRAHFWLLLWQLQVDQPEPIVTVLQTEPLPRILMPIHQVPAEVEDTLVQGCIKRPRQWEEAPVIGPSHPGTGSTSGLSEQEWNNTQFLDLPTQAALVQGTIFQQLMNVAKNQESRLAGLETLHRKMMQMMAEDTNILNLADPVDQLLVSAGEAYEEVLENYVQIAARVNEVTTAHEYGQEHRSRT
eukprot:4843045-Amphidinium_carterae.1